MYTNKQDMEANVDSHRSKALLDIGVSINIPPINGADRRAWHLFESTVAAGGRGIFVGRRYTVDCCQKELKRTDRSSKVASKRFTAIKALLLGSEYWQSKFISPEINHLLTKSVEDDSIDIVNVHFLLASKFLQLFRGRSLRVAVDTHNFDPQFYGAYCDRSRNPLLRLLAKRSIDESRRRLMALPTGVSLIHVSRDDSLKYQQIRPDLNHFVVENGCTLLPRSVWPKYSGQKKVLLFVASLSTKMNEDAVINFANNFWGQLKSVADVVIAGSSPSKTVSALCTQFGWRLMADVSEEQLTRLYAEANFVILPFSYGAGSKLKLLEACARGVPALSTRPGVGGVEEVPESVYVSDDATVWRQRVESGIDPVAASQAGIAFAEKYSWPSLGIRRWNILKSMEQITL